MKKVVIFAILMIFAFNGALVFAPAKRVLAANASDWRAGQIIDDTLFADSSSMNVEQIQSFLNNKVPVCDSYGQKTSELSGGVDYNRDGRISRAEWAQAKGYPTRFTCLKDYYEVPKNDPGAWIPENNYGGKPIPAGAISASQMIYNAAQRYGISPKVLLVTIHKESAGPLTIDEWPLGKQYTYAMGAHCPDSGPGGSANCDANYAGFSIQISESAALMRWYIDSMNQPWWAYKKPFQTNYILWNVEPTGCGGGNVYINTKATAALYTYTPYQPNAAALANLYGTGDGCSAYGNRNFWRIYTDWFGNPTGSLLVRTPSNATYHLLSNGKRFSIPNGDILYAYGIQALPLQVVSDAMLANIPDGGMLGTLFKKPSDDTIYLADGGKRHGIASGEYCLRWGLACGDPSAVKELGPEITNQLGDGGLLQPIMRFDNRYYLMENGKKMPFLSTKSLQERGYSTGSSTSIINWTNAIRDFGVSLPENNTFVKIASTNTIYLYSGNMFFGLPDYPVFLAWFGSNSVCYLDSQSTYNQTPPATAAVLRGLVQSPDQSLSLITPEIRYSLVGAASQAGRATTLSQFPQLQAFLNSKSAGQIDETKAIALPSGVISGLKNNTLRPFPSLFDLRLYYNDSNVISTSSAILDSYPSGKLLIAPGRVIKPTWSGAMYLYGSDRNMWALGSLQELAAANTWAPGAIESNLQDIDINEIKIYNGLVSMNGHKYAVQPDGTVRQIPENILSRDAILMPVEGPLLNRMKIVNDPVRFIRFDNGTIFITSDNTIRPISSLSAYFNLGGNPQNTISISVKAVPNFNIGQVL